MEVVVRAEVDEGAESELGPGVPIEIDLPIGKLMAQPGDVGSDGIAPGRLEFGDAVGPLRTLEAEVVDFPG